ncbi:MAG: hypothetical protein AB7G28_20970 [Pirellulales bacterium]
MIQTFCAKFGKIKRFRPTSKGPVNLKGKLRGRPIDQFFSSVVLFGGLLLASTTSAKTFHINSDTLASADSELDVLRSAYYLRAIGRDSTTPAADPHDLNIQLQRHFDLVLAALVANGERSLDVALSRLQRSRGELWTDNERTAWRQRLAQHRALNILRLRIYQLRGQFPRNEHVSSRAVPIFVDKHDTACAVGHLMRESGWADAVAAIQRTNCFVYVTDVRNGPLVAWVLVSGLTQEEAALIQPSYSPQYTPPPFDTGLDVLTYGGSITKNGLLFDNFSFIAGELADPASFPQVPPTTNQVNLARHGATVGQGALQSFGSTEPVFDDWLYVGAQSSGDRIFDGDDTWGILYSYDIATTDPTDRLVAASLKSSFANFNIGPPGFETWIYPGGASGAPALAHFLLEDTLNAFGVRWLVDEDSASFAPQQKLTVVTAVKLEGPAMFSSIVHSFQIAPEPAAVTLGLLAIVGISVSRRRY